MSYDDLRRQSPRGKAFAGLIARAVSGQAMVEWAVVLAAVVGGAFLAYHAADHTVERSLRTVADLPPEPGGVSHAAVASPAGEIREHAADRTLYQAWLDLHRRVESVAAAP